MSLILKEEKCGWTPAVKAGLACLTGSSFETIREFYSVLKRPVSDLNPLMMVVWRAALSLHYLIEDGVLYVVAKWNNEPALWGPPLGNRVTLQHIRRALGLLQKISPALKNPKIFYLSEDYDLWPSLIRCDEFVISTQAKEYIYEVEKLATLATSDYKKKRNSYNRFQQRYKPTVTQYSPEFAPQCLGLLELWSKQKGSRITPKEKHKFNLERTACALALQEAIPLTGVVAFVQGEVQAFSLGTAHGRDGFNCMFEKTNLDMPGASSFIFTEIARSCLGRYSEINAGEDWGINYLAESKRLWKPSRMQTTYFLSRNTPNR